MASPRRKAKAEYPDLIEWDGKNTLLPTVFSLSASRRGERLPFFAMHDNGGRPYLVFYDEESEKAIIYAKLENEESSEWSYFPSKYQKVKVFSRVDLFFVGKSPRNELTDFGGGYGPEFTGNTVLFRHGTRGKYIYFNTAFEEFEPEQEIVQYFSPVGNNDVPYPFALDAAGTIYHFDSKILIRRQDKDYNLILKEPTVYLYVNDGVGKRRSGWEKFSTRSVLKRLW